MGAVSILFGGPRRAKIGELVLDASIEEQHSSRNEVTEHPVEAGADVTDHVRQQPDRITMTGQVSNHPIERFTVGTGITDPERAETAYRQLLGIVARGELVTVVTTLRTYYDMVIESLDVPRNVKLGNVVRFTATLKNITIVDSETVALAATPDTDNARAKPAGHKGKVATKPATATQGSSMLSNLIGRLGG